MTLFGRDDNEDDEDDEKNDHGLFVSFCGCSQDFAGLFFSPSRFETPCLGHGV